MSAFAGTVIESGANPAISWRHLPEISGRHVVFHRQPALSGTSPEKMKFKAIGTLLTILWLSIPAHAADLDDWDVATDIGGYGLIGIALALPLVKGDQAGFKQAGYSIVAASAVALIGKSTTNQQRPDNSGDDSFPSNHTATAFAAATTLNRRYGWKAGFPAYGVAAFVGAGRVEAEKHYWRDVLVGAAVGSVSGWIFTDKFNDDVQLTPWNRHGSSGLMMSVKW